ncbi:hypothetical protein IJ596_02345 [bacterium]|nr:hypothetical protein [bacterium]
MNIGMPFMYGLNNMFSYGNYYNNYSYPNFGASIFNCNYSNSFFVPNFYNMSFPGFGLFNFGFGGLSSSSNSDKSVLDEIAGMQYDNSNLTNKLDELKNPNNISSYISSGHKLASTIEAADGGKIYLYEDSNGNSVGSINRDSAGKIRNLSLDIKDGGSISINVGSDGKITDRTAISDKNAYESNIGVKYEDVLKSILNDVKDYQVKAGERTDDKTLDIYEKDGKQFAYVLKDKNGKIVSISDFRGKVNGRESSRITFNDSDGDGKISKGEGFVRNDIGL